MTVKANDLYKHAKKNNENIIRDIIDKIDEAIKITVNHTNQKEVRLQLITTDQEMAGKYNICGEKNLWYKVEYCIYHKLNKDKIFESIKNYYLDYGYTVIEPKHDSTIYIQWQLP